MNVPEVLLGACLLAVAVVTLLSNASVLLCFARSADIRSQAAAVLVLNLSLSNVLLAVVNMPATLLGVAGAAHGPPPFGDACCRAVSFADTLLTTNGMLSMAALSVDRWTAVAFPLSYAARVGRREACVAVAYSWLHSLAFAVAALLMSWGGYSPAYASCALHYGGRRDGGPRHAAFAAFTALLHGTGFALCLAVMTLAYLKVLRVARRHCRRIDVITVQTLLLLVDIHPSVKERCLVEQKKRRQRAVKKICLFIGSFVVCFAPYVITRLVQLAPHVHVHRYWGITTKCLSYSKAASDPFVYSLLRQQYRKVLTGVTDRMLRRDRYSLSSNSTSSGMEADGICRVA